MTLRLTRRRLMQQSAAAAFAGLVVPAVSRAQQATPIATTVASPVAIPGTEWPFYGRDLFGTKSTNEGTITQANISSLGQLWEVNVDGPVSATPVIAGGVVYAGSYDGRLYALDLKTGASVWTYETIAAVQ